MVVYAYTTAQCTKQPRRNPWGLLEETGLLLVLLGVLTVTTLRGLGALALDTAGAAAAVGRLERVVDVLLRVEADNERGDVDDLLADADVALADEDTGVVDRLGEAELEDLGLEAALEEVLGLEGEHVVETHARVVEHTDADETTDERVALEETLGVLVVELEELTSRTTDLGQGELNAPDLTLVAETVLAGELELGVETRGLVRALGDLVGLRLLAALSVKLVIVGHTPSQG